MHLDITGAESGCFYCMVRIFRGSTRVSENYYGA